MSSAWAPKHRMVWAWGRGRPRISALPAGLEAGLPDLPGRIPGREQLVHPLLLLRRVHRHPEAVVVVGQELPLGEQALEGLEHQLFPFAQVVEDLLAEHEESTVDADPGFHDVVKAGDDAFGIRRDRMVGEIRLAAEEARDAAMLFEMLELLGQ